MKNHSRRRRYSLLYLYRSADHSLRRRCSLLYRSAEPLTDEAGFFAVSVQNCTTTHRVDGFLWFICTEVHNHSLRRWVSLLYLYRSAQPLTEEAGFFAVSVQKSRTTRCGGAFFAVSVQKCTTTHWGGGSTHWGSGFLCCFCTEVQNYSLRRRVSLLYL